MTVLRLSGISVKSRGFGQPVGSSEIVLFGLRRRSDPSPELTVGEFE